MKAVNWFYSGCTALVVIIYWATNTWPFSTIFNVAEYAFNQNETWWQGWVSATSGWAAAIVAGFTAAIIIRQMNRTEQHHRENISRLEAPERSTAKQIIAIMARIVALSSLMDERAKSEQNDLYATDGQFFLGMYSIIRHLLDDPVFIRVQTMDVSLSAFYHKQVSEKLDTALTSCSEGLRRARKSFAVGNESQLKIERQQPKTFLNAVLLLQNSIEEAINERFPDMEV